MLQVVGTADTCATAASPALSWVRSSSYSALPASPWGRGFSGILSPVGYSVVDPHHFYAVPDSTYHSDADPDSVFYLMRVRIFI